MLLLTGASVLTYDQQSKFFGTIFRYQNERNLTVRGLVTTLNNTQGISGIESMVQNYFDTDTDYDSIVINGYNFGAGKVKSVSFDPSNDVKTKSYTIGITCFQTGNLFNLAGVNYSGTQENAAAPYYLLDNLEEKFGFSKNGEKFGYNHSVSLRFNSGDGLGTSAIQKAKTLASQLINVNVPFGFLISGENTGIGKKTYNESYDLITSQCSFEEVYEREANNSGLIYYLTNNFNRDSNGISTVSENAQIEDVLLNPSVRNFNRVASGINDLLAGSFARCSGVLALYSGVADPLFTGYLSLSKSINSFARVGSYTIAYTNNPAQVTGGYSWEYTNTLDKAVQYYNVGENGSIIGHGNPVINGLNIANTIYPTIQAGISARLNTFYATLVTPQLPLNKTSEVKSSSLFRGGITYSANYTDNPTYTTSSAKVKMEGLEISDSYPVQLINKFNIFNYKEIVQNSNNATLGNRTVNLTLLGTRDSILADMKSYAMTRLNSNIPNGTDTFLDKIEYGYSPQTKEFNVSAGWTYQTGAFSGIT